MVKGEYSEYIQFTWYGQLYYIKRAEFADKRCFFIEEPMGVIVLEVTEWDPNSKQPIRLHKVPLAVPIVLPFAQHLFKGALVTKQ